MPVRLLERPRPSVRRAGSVVFNTWVPGEFKQVPDSGVATDFASVSVDALVAQAGGGLDAIALLTASFSLADNKVVGDSVSVSRPALVAPFPMTWDPHGEGIVGYRVYVGLSPGVYDGYLSFGTTLPVTISTMEQGVTYYVVVKAVDAQGVESDAADETAWLNGFTV